MEGLRLACALATTLVLLFLLAACGGGNTVLIPGLPPGPAPQLLPPLVPDPLAATGPGTIRITLEVSAPVLALGPSAALGSATKFGSPDMSAPLGLYPDGHNRPVRQRAFGPTEWAGGGPATGIYCYTTDFANVPLGNYTVRMAWWTYDYAEDYWEALRGPQISLTASTPSATQALTFGELRGTGMLPGRVLYAQGDLTDTEMTFDFMPAGATQFQRVAYTLPAGTAPVDGRLFFELRHAPAGSYSVDATYSRSYASYSVTDQGASTPPQAALYGYNKPLFRHWPVLPGDNMFFGYVRFTGAQEWQGDLRIAARPAGSSPDSPPVTWLWFDPARGISYADMYANDPWHAAFWSNGLPEGMPYGLGQLPLGRYDIYAELFGLQPGQKLSVKLASNESLPPTDASRLYRDPEWTGAPYWVETPLELNLTSEQATAFGP